MEATYARSVSTADSASEVAAALLAVACAALLRAVLEPILDPSHAAFTFFVFLSAAVLVAALVGYAPALLTLVFGALAAWFLFVPPRYTFPVSDLTAVSSLGIYLLTGPGITYLAASYRLVAINAASAREMTARVEELERELAARASADPRPATFEERFRTPADEMKDAAIYLLDVHGRHASWNRGVRRLLGYDKVEFLHLTCADLHPPEDRAAGIPERQLAEAVNHGRASQERWLVRKAGTRFWASLAITSVHGQHGKLVGFACTLRDLTGLKQVEEELRRHREALELAHEAAGLGAWQYDLGTTELRFDSRARALFGLPADATVTYDTWAAALHPADRMAAEELWRRALHDRKPFSAEYRVLWPDGSIHWLVSMGRGTSRPPDEVQRLTGVVLDVTERKQAEERLQEVLRLEAVGRLAGGIAHDLNNMLAAILGFSDFLARSLEPGDQRRHDVEQIAQAANRSASLTRQLLAFARRELIQPRLLDVNAVVRRTEGMLRPALGPNIELVFRLARDAGVVHADPGQLEQIVMNLVLNARDAMPLGGRVTIETMSLVLGRSSVSPQLAGELPALGRYLMLSVSDTGHGMDATTLQRIWEPFFTTKPVGQGTGLGLSAVYGAVKQSGGFVWAESEPGRGTVVGVYWPEMLLAPEPAMDEPVAPPAPGGDETVLVVDDEPLLRALAARTLTSAGYRCLEAADAGEALRVIEQEAERLDLVVADVVMPGMSGGALGERLAHLRPTLPVLYTSGFTDEDMIRRGLLGAGRPFLQKPFSPGHLARTVREVLDAAACSRERPGDTL